MQRALVSHTLQEYWLLIVIGVLFCAALGLNKPRGWTLALSDEVAKVKPCAAEGEVDGE